MGYFNRPPDSVLKEQMKYIRTLASRRLLRFKQLLKTTEVSCPSIYVLIEVLKWMRLHQQSMAGTISLVMTHSLPQVLWKLNTLVAPALQG